MWFAHSGKDHKSIEFPLMADYQTADHVILDGFDFADHFSAVYEGEQLR